jgi:hypothetical protein
MEGEMYLTSSLFLDTILSGSPHHHSMAHAQAVEGEDGFHVRKETVNIL